MNSIRYLLLEQGRGEDWPYRGVTFEDLKLAEGRLHDRSYVDCCLPFPTPPIPARSGVIEPLCDYGSLVDEGIAQDHCVATLVAEVVRGEIYAYRVLAPTRATLALQRTGDRVETNDTGFRYSGELLRRIEEPGLEGSDFPTGAFSWGCTWDLLHGGNGVIYASYVSWCLFYDRELVNDVLRILEKDPHADTEASRAIVAWEGACHQKLRMRVGPP